MQGILKLIMALEDHKMWHFSPDQKNHYPGSDYAVRQVPPILVWQTELNHKLFRFNAITLHLLQTYNQL